MGLFKPQRKVFAPVPRLAIAVAVSATVFFISRGSLLLELSASSLYPSDESSDPGILPVTINATENNAEQSNHTADTSTLDRPESCLRYILYDKPVKTGSSAITSALSRYLDTIPEPTIQCNSLADCSRIGEEVCAGTQRGGHLIHHIHLNSSMTACLRSKGYYHVTSVREPEQRIISAWRFSQTKKANHYGIPYDTPFETFLEQFPRCALYSYYDGLKSRCSREEAEERVEEIASRFDEVIDLQDAVISDVHRRIQPLLKEVNVAPSGRAKTGELKVPYEVVEIEYMLYNKLREKRMSLAKQPNRLFCGR